MDTTAIVDFLYEIIYLLIVFGVFITLAVVKGKQSLINLILALYLGLLLSIEFPYYEQLSPGAESGLKIGLFAGFTVLAHWLFARLMPRNFDEKAFEGFGLKFLFAAGGTILVMAFSYNALPITEFITPGSPIQTLFAPQEYFFWWLIAPLVFLFML